MKVTRNNNTSAVFGRAATALALSAALAAPAAQALTAPAVAEAKPNKQVKLYIDPGHGGSDPGAVSGGLLEKDSALQISRRVARLAKRQGWKVKMSRNSDRFVGLNARPAEANAWKADVFVSIHSNSVGNKKLGHMTIYRGKAGQRLGKRVMKELNPLTKYKDIGNRSDVRNLAVLRGASMPAVLVELLSVSSTAERKVLRDPNAQQHMAEAIVRGVAKDRGTKYRPPVAKKAKAAPKPKRKLESTPTPKAESKQAPKTKQAPTVKPAPKAEPTQAPAPEKRDVKRAPAPAPAPAPASLFGQLLKILFG